VQAVPRNEAHLPADALDAEPEEERWSRRARFFFIIAAAALCWTVPGVAIYLLVAQY
jgi:hypothetical protein